MEFSKFAQREVCKVRTDAHLFYAKRFKEDGLKCADLMLPENYAPKTKYNEEVEQEIYQR